MTENVDVEQLRSELRVFVREDDHEGVRRVYRDLLHAGWTKHEIMNEFIRLSGTKPSASEPDAADPKASARSVEEQTAVPLAGQSPLASATILATSDPADTAISDSCNGSAGTAVIAEFGIEVSRPEKVVSARPPRAIRSTVFMIPLVGLAIIGFAEPQAIRHLLTGVFPPPSDEQTNKGLAPREVAAVIIHPQQSRPTAALPSGSLPEETTSLEPRVQPAEADPIKPAGSVSQLAALPKHPPADPTPVAPPTEPTRPALASANLVERGDALFGAGDVSSARLYYQRAAEAGDAQAALRLGETHDPAFLAQIRFIGPLGNPEMAVYWYKRAQELGAPEAAILLEAIGKPGASDAPPGAVLRPADPGRAETRTVGPIRQSRASSPHRKQR
jgi:hypothetical protein